MPADAAAPAAAANLELDRDLVAALAWCRLGGQKLGRPADDAAFGRAKGLGLLAQDPVWRATARGEGVLIALGLLNGAPAPDLATVCVCWAASERFPGAQFVAAFPDGLADCWTETYKSQLADAQRWFADFGDVSVDGPWRFWTTVETIERPREPDAEAERR